MSQPIKAKTEIEFYLPPGTILVQKSEWDNLNDAIGRGEWKDFNWFKSKTGITKKEVLDDMILKPFRDELDVENGGFVHYPDCKGDPWKFLKLATENWLETNFNRVYRYRTNERLEVGKIKEESR
ncbi:hypothetical protein IGI37_001990 [Enterococcus sp. AZ194]|uniref:DUF771 domain-containing protein n=1 Tax=Enterococcus sp. AZ194 TaxID=2774629 RepID=UPI003F1E9A4F